MLLLTLLSSMQMSWAATHICDAETGVRHTILSTAPELNEHIHQLASGERADVKGEKVVDTNCGATHGCHGLHHLMGLADSEFAAEASTQMPSPTGAAPPRPGPRFRIERPNWPAS